MENSASAEKRVDALVERAWDIILKEEEGYERFDAIRMDHPDVRQILIYIAEKRQVTFEDLEKVSMQVESEAEVRKNNEKQFEDACRSRSDSLHVFRVYNTADRSMTVIAKDADCARFFAWNADHIHRPINGRAIQMSESDETALRVSGSAMGRALRDGYPGAVQRLGNNVVMQESKRVYTPMTIVDN